MERRVRRGTAGDGQRCRCSVRMRLPFAVPLTCGFAAVFGTVFGCAATAARTHHYDVVVYGGTAGGAISAVAAAQEGASVALLEPRRHIGGMVSGGLGRTDFGKKEVVGGMSRGFFERVGQHYGEPIAWYFEPHVAEQVFRNWLETAGVAVFFEYRLDTVHKQAARVVRAKMENGAVFAARVFIDASYEGDLMARAGVAYTWGREGRDKYGESLAGRIEHSPKHQFNVRVSPYDDRGQLLPCVWRGDPGRPGQGDRKVQAYNFRLCLCSRKDNQAPFPKPADYEAGRYELLERYLHKAKPAKLGDIMHIGRMPNDKTDVNNNGPFSTDHIGGSWEYPDADYRQRQEIWDDHVSYVQGLFYFLANDPGVPKHLQNELNTWGLARDEFVDTGHWPHQLYVREARRMIGQYVMTQADLQTQRTKPDSIGMGSYNSDSHNVQRIPTPDGAVVNEGDMQVPVRPYEIAYRAITPKRGECENLLVPVCVSATHVAYSSIRMEPVYMILGHSAGVAAARAARHDVPVPEVDIAWLQSRLRRQEQILSLDDVTAAAPYVGVKSLPGIVVDNAAAVVTGTWVWSTSVRPFVANDYIHDGNESKGQRKVRFIPNLPADGDYEIRVAYTAHPNRATNVPITVNAANAPRTLKLNQRKPPDQAPFSSLGTFPLRAGGSGYVEIGTAGTDGHVIADAIQWLPQQESPESQTGREAVSGR